MEGGISSPGTGGLAAIEATYCAATSRESAWQRVPDRLPRALHSLSAAIGHVGSALLDKSRLVGVHVPTINKALQELVPTKPTLGRFGKVGDEALRKYLKGQIPSDNKPKRELTALLFALVDLCLFGSHPNRVQGKEAETARRLRHIWLGDADEDSFPKPSKNQGTEDLREEPSFFHPTFKRCPLPTRYCELPYFYVNEARRNEGQTSIVCVSGYTKFHGGRQKSDIRSALQRCAAEDVSLYFVAPAPVDDSPTDATLDLGVVESWLDVSAVNTIELPSRVAVATDGSGLYSHEYFDRVWRYTAVITELEGEDRPLVSLVPIRPSLVGWLNDGFVPEEAERRNFAEWFFALRDVWAKKDNQSQSRADNRPKDPA